MKVIHPFEPIYDKDSKILILGSLPSVKTREAGYPYAHPQNRFWKIMECLFNEKIINHKKFLLKNKIAIWDSIAACDISGSSDSSIKNIEPNYKIKEVIDNSQIKKVFTTGSKSYEVYQKYIYPITHISAIKLPSTSPANAAYKFDRLLKEYSIIKEVLD